eukprot:8655888-Pyramimonas_sp.AAC.1
MCIRDRWCTPAPCAPSPSRTWCVLPLRPPLRPPPRRVKSSCDEAFFSLAYLSLWAVQTVVCYLRTTSWTPARTPSRPPLGPPPGRVKSSCDEATVFTGVLSLRAVQTV